jgi:hypothetical protein
MVIRCERKVALLSWGLALFIEAIQAWNSRYVMQPDGMSYVDVADAYLRGDWDMAINAYWSPLYSWMLSLAFLLLRPSAFWEFAVVHGVNYLIFIWTMGCFHFLLGNLIQYRRQLSAQDVQAAVFHLPDWSIWAVGYAIFLWAVNTLWPISFVSPDMLMGSFVFLACAVILRIRMGYSHLQCFVALGAILGLGYLAKAAMFPLAIVFLGVAFLSVGDFRKGFFSILVAGFAYVVVSAPFITALSVKKGSFTFGESGAMNFGWSVSPSGGSASKYPRQARRLSEDPTIYEFSDGKGTYPIWYDPAYWYKDTRVSNRDASVGVKNARVSVKDLFGKQLNTLKTSAVRYFILFYNMQGLVLFFFLILFLFSFGTGTMIKGLLTQWSLLVPALAGMMMFALVFVQWRYIAAFVVVFWLGLVCAIRLPRSAAAERLTACVCIALVIMLLTKYVSSNIDEAFAVASEGIGARKAQIHSEWLVAEELRRIGLQPGDRVAYIGNSTRAYWAHLGRFRIVAEIHGREGEKFWKIAPADKARAISILSGTGAKIIVSEDIPDSAVKDGWQRLTGSNAYVYDVRSRDLGGQKIDNSQ